MPTQHPHTEEDTILLNMYLSPGCALFAICEELEITYSELERRLNQPHIAEAIERATRLHEQRARTLARCRSDDSVCTLSYLASQPEINPETQRKAASQLLRIGTASVSERRATAHESERPMPTATVKQRPMPTATVKERPMATATVRERAQPTPRRSRAPQPTNITERDTQTRASPSHPHRLTHAPSHARDTSPVPAHPNTHTYRLHPFAHPRITRTETPPNDPRPP